MPIWIDPLRRESQLDFVGILGETLTETEVSNVVFEEGKCASTISIDCPENYFQCLDRQECVPSKGVCDGTSECSDSSDEEPPACGEFIISP